MSNEQRTFDNGAALEQARQAAGLTLDKAAEQMGIPKRTFHDWTRQKSKCPAYALDYFLIITDQHPNFQRVGC